MTKITNEQKNKILQDLSSKNEWKAVQEAGSLIEKINDVEDERMPGEIYSNLLTDERLKDIQNPQPNSNLQKAVQALRDNGADLALDELIDHEKRKREIRINRRQERNIYQSMVDIKDVEMEHFDPHDYSSSSTTSSSIFQSMVGTSGLKIKEFKPRRGASKETKEKSKSNQIESTNSELTLNRLIGRGGYGEVYYGKWDLQEVAVKKLYLSPHSTSEPDLKDIKREIDILKNLRNKHIIQYYDTYSNDQELLIIMDYAENGTLTKFIDDNKDKKHNWDLNNKFIQQMTLGLAYIHHQGIIHRDLKSMNILLTKDYNVKISDFGLSKTKNISSSHSKHSGKVGTLRWMAPELLEDTSNLKYSEQSDIYALGMVIWEIAAKCTTPFKNDDNGMVIVRIRWGTQETIPTNTPKNIQDIIQRCWENDPSKRIALSDILGKITREDESSSVENLPKPLNSGIKEQSYEDKQGDLLNTHQYSLSIQLGTPPRRNYKVTNNEGDNQESLTTTDTSTSSNKGLNRQKQDNLQEQIMSKSLALEKLVDSAKEKLKSDSRFNFKRKKRNEKLKKTFEVLPATSKELVKKIENIKKNLSKKLTKEEINNLCQISRELRELHLSTQSEQKSQVQIPPK